MRDPRVMMFVPRHDRGRMAVLWDLCDKLLSIMAHAREPALAQIKLTWWRDQLDLLQKDVDRLPKGEPLLAQLQQNWHEQNGLAELASDVEAMLLADEVAAESEAARQFGQRMFALSANGEATGVSGERLGLIICVAMKPATPNAKRLLHEASLLPRPQGGGRDIKRACFMLDRWAGLIARRIGQRSLRRESLLLLRIGMIGR